MPLVGVDAEGDVDLDVFDAAAPAGYFPGELGVGRPGGAHAEEGSVRDGLRVRRDAVVFFGREVHEFGFEAREHAGNEGEGGVGGTVLDEDEGLAGGRDVGAVERVAGDDFDVDGEVFLEGFDLGGFAGGLSADNCTHLGRCWPSCQPSHIAL